MLEILIAVASFAFLMVGVNVIVDNSITSRDIVITEDREFLQIENALARIEKDIAHLYTPLFYSYKHDPKADPFNYDKQGEKIYRPNAQFSDHERYAFVTQEGHPVPIFQSDNPQELTILTNANRRKVENTKESRFAWIRYQLLDMENTEDADNSGLSELVRQFNTANPHQKIQSFDEARPYVLLSRIKDFKFEFWNPQRKEFTDTLRTLENGRHMIEAIKVSFTWVDSVERETNIERTFLPNLKKEAYEKYSELYKNNKDREADLIEENQSNDSSPNSGGFQ